MKQVVAEHVIDVPRDVKVQISSRQVTVTGKYGTLTRDFKHLNVEIYATKNKEGKDVVVVSFCTTFLFGNTIIFTKIKVYCRAQEIKQAKDSITAIQ